jgi:hypothetical protein
MRRNLDDSSVTLDKFAANNIVGRSAFDENVGAKGIEHSMWC